MANQSSPDKTRQRLELVVTRLRGLFGIPRRKSRLPEPLDLLIATILSQNTNDINSHRAFTDLKSAYPALRELVNVKPKKIEPLIKVGGIANKKSKVIVEVINEIMVRFKRFDKRSLRKIGRDELIERLRNLNGVGYKTASCVLLFSLGDEDAFPVDTHVHRILNRLGVVNEKTPDKTFIAVRSHIPAGRGYELHLNLIKFGRKTCTAQRPRCYDCGLYDICRWKEKESWAQDRKDRQTEKDVEFMLLENV